MAILKCKMCGGDIELSADKTFGTCEFCGSTMTFPKVDDEQRAAAFNRGNHFRRTGEFDKALAVYERIVQEDENDAEAHWCCALCRFGIEYVEDPNTLEYLPTCHRASFDSFLEDVDYLAALEHSDGITRRQYQKDAAKIAEVQRGILATSQNEEPFDVFLCYKETEDDGSRTRDSLYAQDIYYQLTEQGRRVFFSRITLEDKAGTEYEPYIFAALNSAKVMILVTTSAEHANAVWVKNEWSRFLSLMRKDRSKLLLPCYRDMDPYDLPEALSVLQSYDMSKIGFIQDLTRGINKVLDGAKPKQTAKGTVVIQQQSGYAAPLLERAFMFLEDGDWAKADDFCEQVLNLEPKNALAYLGKLMAELKVHKREQLKDQAQPFDDRNNYQKALRFADGKLKAELSGIISFINDRNETARKEDIYQRALATIERKSVEGYREAARLFESISDYKDSSDRAKECLEQAAIFATESVYRTAVTMMASGGENNYRSAASKFRTISGYKDADAKEKECLEKAILAKKEADYIKYKQVFEDRAVPRDGNWASAIGNYYVPSSRNASSRFQNLFNAIRGFEILGDYKDSRELAEKSTAKLYELLCKSLESSNDPQELMTVSDFFTSLIDYKDSAEKAKESLEKKEACRKQMLYSDAVKTMNGAGLDVDKLELAIRKFASVAGWQNADELVETCRRRIEQIKAKEEAARQEAERKAEAERLEAERKAEAERRAEIKKARMKKTLLILSVVAVLLMGLFVFWKTVYEPQQAYNQAVQLYDGKQYEEAIAAFDALGSYKDSANQSKRIKEEITAAELAKKIEEENAAAYAEAEEMLRTKDYEKAITAFSKLGEYRDSKAKVEEAKNAFTYEEAEYLLKTKRYDEAIAAFLSLGSYKDSEQRAESATSEKYTTIYARAESYMKEGKLYEAATTFYSIQDYMDSRKRCFDLWGRITYRRTIAVGSHHTVALRTDGTLIGNYDKKGSTYYGACNFSDWDNIIAIAAGSGHTVGLKADGTVVATGYTVFGWEDIVAIAAGNGFTVGLKADGTVVAKGDNDKGQCNVTGWKNIVAIATGDNHTLGLRADGTVCAVGYNYSRQCDVQNWKDIVKISAGMTNSVGLRTDGSVVIAGDNSHGQKEAENWMDIVDIAAGPYHIAGVQSNGKAFAVGSDNFGNALMCAVGDWTNIVSIAAGYDQTVGLRADGTVVAAGPNSKGDRNTSSWKGIRTK